MVDFKKASASLRAKREKKKAAEQAEDIISKAPPRPTSTIVLTPDQDRALVAITRWIKDPSANWIFTLVGNAGTGKTALLHYLINSVGVPFIAAAPTGKAASVLRGKIPGLRVRTNHQLLYAPSGQNMERLNTLEQLLEDARVAGTSIAGLLIEIKEEKERLKREDVRFSTNPSPDLLPGKLIIVDEASMVSKRVRDDYEATGCKVLFVGDDGQLPPVKEESWFIDYKHDARLSTVMRQALDSPIIRFSIQVRDGNINMDEFKEGLCCIRDKSKVPTEEWLRADQILTGSNESRRRINRFTRKKLGFERSVLPVKGDKMICLKNDHKKLPPWINGVIFSATDDVLEDGSGCHMLKCDYDGLEQELDFYHYHTEVHYRPDLLEEPREMRRGVFEADYAYSITVHKSQGSEWPYVIVADDGIQAGNKPFRQRWLYTAATRAKERLMIVR